MANTIWVPVFVDDGTHEPIEDARLEVLLRDANEHEFTGVNCTIPKDFQQQLSPGKVFDINIALPKNAIEAT